MKKRGVFFTWFLSYISVLLVPIVIISVTYTFTGKMLEDKIDIANTSLLKQVQTVVDGRITEIENLGMQIALNQRIKVAINVKERFLPKDRMNLYKAAQDFKVYKASNNFIKSSKNTRDFNREMNCRRE
ncbi:MAG TPA: hypothetical protein VFD57_08435 [Clostridia bacterium]|nr:hypothetical protein [Clostridia bacterium]